jgi:hypothetical protein
MDGSELRAKGTAEGGGDIREQRRQGAENICNSTKKERVDSRQ